jgi:hypothetical protein
VYILSDIINRQVLENWDRDLGRVHCEGEIVEFEVEVCALLVGQCSYSGRKLGRQTC